MFQTRLGCRVNCGELIQSLARDDVHADRRRDPQDRDVENNVF
jgi:hypothetical protein